MNGLQQHTAYFKALATSFGFSFEYGGSERILNRQSSQLRYPVLWLEVPDVRLIGSGGLRRNFVGAFCLLNNVEPDDYAAQDAILDDLLDKCVLITQQMRTDVEQNHLFEFDPDGTTYEARTKWSADDDFGWRVSYTIIGAPLCL